MCNATVGAAPVSRCTIAASSIFSYGVRGTPSWANTLNRVPEFAYAHDAVSTACCRSADITRCRVEELSSVIAVSLQASSSICIRETDLEVEVVDVALVEHRGRTQYDDAVLLDGVLAELTGLERLSGLAADL